MLTAGSHNRTPTHAHTAGSHNRTSPHTHTHTQIVEVVEERAREGLLKGLLKKHASGSKTKDRVIIFGLYKKECARLERTLQGEGWNCVAVHGDKGQRDREEAVNAFKAGKINILIATDVASRGLDIPDVEVVINFSFPLTIEVSTACHAPSDSNETLEASTRT